MGVATTAGQNVASNARGLSLSDIIGHAAQTALGAVTGPASPFALPAMLGRVGYDFGGGLAGAADAAPAGSVTVPLAARTPAAAKTPAAAAAAMVPDIQQAYDRGQARYNGSHDNGLDAVISRYAAAKGGPVSLGEIAYIANIADKNTKVQPKPITPAMQAITDASNFSGQVYESKMKAAQAEKDPAKAQELQQSAVNDRMAHMLAIAAHANQVDTNVAGTMNGIPGQ